jgi:membrane protease YdiL (CAAX protease family)
MDTHLNTKRILIFLAFAFGIPWTAALVLYLTVGMNNLMKAQSLANMIAIATPWLANLFTRLITKEGRGHLMLRSNLRRGWLSYLAAWLLLPLAIFMGAAAFYLLFPQSFDANLSLVRKDMAASPLLAAMTNPWMGLLVSLLLAMFIEIPFRAIPTFGEEFGWRGYLLPKLVEHFAGTTAEDPEHASSLNTTAARKAVLLVGVVHGIWHWPLIFMAVGFTTWVHFLTPLVYLVFTCSLSVLTCWVTIRSGSVWPATVVHGLLGRYTILAVYPLKGSTIPLVGPDPTGLIGGIGLTILALVLLFSHRAFTGVKAADSQSVQPVESIDPDQ